MSSGGGYNTDVSTDSFEVASAQCAVNLRQYACASSSPPRFGLALRSRLAGLVQPKRVSGVPLWTGRSGLFRWGSGDRGVTPGVSLDRVGAGPPTCYSARCVQALRRECARTMDTNVFIDSIMRQTIVLIAQFAATAGIRAPLAHLADEVFLSLSSELESQGVSRKLVADMFGMALRSYQRRVQRLRESSTNPGQTLWQSVLAYLEAQRKASRRDLQEHFYSDDPEALGAVLNDLVRSGLASRTGTGSTALFTATPEEDRRRLASLGREETAAALVWLDLCRNPETATSDTAERLGLAEDLVQTAIESLIAQGRVSIQDGKVRPEPMVIPVGAEAGWEAAVFDHFQAVAGAITMKLRQGATRSTPAETIGGSTLTFEIDATHPAAATVLGLLERVRSDVFTLWNEVEAINAARPLDEQTSQRVTFYFGQSAKLLGDDA